MRGAAFTSPILGTSGSAGLGDKGWPRGLRRCGRAGDNAGGCLLPHRTRPAWRAEAL